MNVYWVIVKLLTFLAVITLSTACSSIGYYSQAISGHFDLLSRARPIPEVIQDQASSAELKRKLSLSQQARDFASQQLHLPDNESYKHYAELERPYVVWNVVATPAYSIKPRQWCFMIVGCLSYRGIFKEQAANELAAELKQQGMDVSVFGSAAYSTLGYFDDPLLNTMMRQGDANLVAVIFHELAHQTVYVENDTAFNEAFATAVEQEGLRRWYNQLGDASQYQAYLLKRQYRHEFYRMITRTRERLDVLFNSAVSDQVKQQDKEAIYTSFKQEYQQWRDSRGYDAFDRWMQRDLNNSHLALIATYQDLVPTFTNLLTSVNGDMQKFYQLVAAIGEKDKPTRQSLLSMYSSSELSAR
ncbi:MAG: aminopeptidase [Thioalkalispiraceae bacterium]|jgi:predicted aminopeptidase